MSFDKVTAPPSVEGSPVAARNISAPPAASRKSPLRALQRTIERNPGWITVPLSAMVVLGIWEYLVRGLGKWKFFVASPSQIGEALYRGFSSGVYLDSWRITFEEMALGFLAGAAIAIVLGALISQVRILGQTLYPYLIAFQTVPKIAIAPLMLVWFGFGLTPKVVLVSTIVFFPIMVNTIDGLNSVDQTKIDLLRSFSASRWQIFRMVKVPGALPYILTGIDIGIVFSVVGAIVGEFVGGGNRGLGVVILAAQSNLDLPGVYAVIVLLAVMGIGLHLAVAFVRKRVVYWAEAQSVASA